jgi:hypothetical protein
MKTCQYFCYYLSYLILKQKLMKKLACHTTHFKWKCLRRRWRKKSRRRRTKRKRRKKDDDIILTNARIKFPLLPLGDKELVTVRFQRKDSLHLVVLLMCSDCLAQ